ncbi:DUF3710 domain-containing protein [Rhodococcus sp. NPDC058514]|uniref:DUF3710 domain-containing protein n=1 Tax=unclassified Rhodococcus (in: high G+C Gram-positive bacteria) TaxID=192944 RepID=UPI00365ADAB2
MFGRKKKVDDEDLEQFEDVRGDEQAERDEFDMTDGHEGGPYDLGELDEAEGAAASRLDLGSVQVPLPEGGQIQVEMAPDGTPQAVHLVTEHGRITIAAYAAPKSPGQWREVAGDLTESLRADQAEISVQSGPWGRELHAVTPNADLRFIGVDGPRWMIRCVVAGPVGSAGLGDPLTAIAREILAGTVVNRGAEPYPVRTPLPVVLPQMLAEQLIAAQEQQMQAQQQAAQAQQSAEVQEAAVAQAAAAAEAAAAAAQNHALPPEERPGGSGSAMQQMHKGRN